MVHDVVIVGAGPAGLMLAGQLVRRGLEVVVFEQGPGPNPVPRAIGLSVPSLEIFRELGLDGALTKLGVPVRRAVLHGAHRQLGQLAFAGLDSDFDYILSIPQNRAVGLLADDLAARGGVSLCFGHRVTGRRDEADRVVVTGQLKDGTGFEAEGRYVVACDGAGSALRKQSPIPFPGAFYSDTFLMGDFADTTGWGAETHVWFTPQGSVEAFPLPDGLRRYVVSTPALVSRDEERTLREQLKLRAAIDVGSEPLRWKMAFKAWHHLAGRYWDGRLVLAGDAAHLMSPIVGQNMNTAFADSELLALVLERVLKGGDAACWLGFYQSIRVRAARAATARAALVMRLGATGGVAWSASRNAGLWSVLHSPARAWLPPVFAMTSIPHRNLAHLGVAVPARP